MLRLENPTNPNIHFFRASEPSTLPGAPSRPHVIDRTETSATISWSRNNKIGSSSLLGYQVSVSHIIKVKKKKKDTELDYQHLSN